MLLQLAAAEKQQASLRSCGQEESLAAINSLKASYDASLARLRESQEGEVVVLQRRFDRLVNEHSASEATLGDVRHELAATKVPTPLTVRLLPCLLLRTYMIQLSDSCFEQCNTEESCLHVLNTERLPLAL
jgi:hypothetical protein